MVKKASFALLLTACAATPVDNPPPQNDIFNGQPGILETMADGYRVRVAPFTVPPGTEMMRCVTVAGLPEDALIIETQSTQGLGGHHVVPFTSTTARVGEVKDCTTASTMANSRFIAPPGFNGRADNMAFRVKAGQPFLMQSHYVNAGSESVIAEDSFTLIKAPADATPQLVDFMAFTNVGFYLPIGASELAHTCDIDKELRILQHFGHMHELGAHYSLQHIAEDGTTVMLDQMQWRKQYRDEPIRHDFPLAAPLVLQGGDKLRLTCGYNNTTDHPVEFPEEMCVAFMMYETTADRPGGFMTCLDGAPEVLE